MQLHWGHLDFLQHTQQPLLSGPCSTLSCQGQNTPTSPRHLRHHANTGSPRLRQEPASFHLLSFTLSLAPFLPHSLALPHPPPPLHSPQLHWSHLDFLQHTQQLPAAMASTAPAHFSTYDTMPAQAVLQDPASICRQNPLFPAWQAAAAAVAAAGRDWRKGWGWHQQWMEQLAGPACLEWLQQMEGKWQRLLLLAAGKPWITPTAAAVESSSSSSSNGSSKRRTKAAAPSKEVWPAVSLQQCATAADGVLPYAPAEKCGPLVFDAPQQQMQALLQGKPSALQAAFSSSSEVWTQLSAAAAAAAAAAGVGGVGGYPWQQQLQQFASLLAPALAAAGWKQHDSSAGEAVLQDPASSSSSSSSDSGSGGWVADVLSRATPAAAEAAAARHAFWQHLQQPGVLLNVLDRLAFLQQLGPEAAAAAAAAAGSHQQPSSAASGSIDPHQLWSVLAAQDATFSAHFPAFSGWQRLARLVEGRPAWQEELNALRGQQLLQWLPQVNSAWERLAFLTAGQPDSSSSSGLWQAISMRDAVAATDAEFVELFPEAGFMSWHALQNRSDMPPGEPSLSSSAAGVAAPAAAQGSAVTPLQGSGSRRRGQYVDAATASSRARVLQVCSWAGRGGGVVIA